MLSFLSRRHQAIAWFFCIVLYLEMVLVPLDSFAAASAPSAAVVANKPNFSLNNGPQINERKADIPVFSPASSEEAKQGKTTGPSQPEMQAFSSVNASNMVDLFSGDFSYNIPLMDVGGYPVNLSYRGGVSMDQEASWVGLGWNVNPGTVTRNMRGLPDDFSGESDSIRKVQSIKENKTMGVTAGADIELTGLPMSLGISGGIFHNNYRGWGIEYGLNASINSSIGSRGTMSAGLSLTNNTQEGVSVTPTLSASLAQHVNFDEALNGSFSVSLPYNSRSGLKGLQLSTGLRQMYTDGSNQKTAGPSVSSFISFASPGFTPSITIPFSSRQFSFTGKLGLEAKVLHPSFFVSGYVSKQFIAEEDTLLALPSYGYMHLQEGSKNSSALLDFNREKEIPYREKPAIPHIAVPGYTYDAFSITGEGTGGMFRPYRSDVGFVHDHFIRTKDNSDRASIDVGVADLAHVGLDINENRAFTQNGPWIENNMAKNALSFGRDSAGYEAVYFRNPSEKSINTKQYYEGLGGDDVVTVKLSQPSSSSSSIMATNYLTRYRRNRAVGDQLITPGSTRKKDRDKRTQVISYLTAAEAELAGLSRHIESYNINQFATLDCNLSAEGDQGPGTGIPAVYFSKREFQGIARTRTDAKIDFDWDGNAPGLPNIGDNNFSVRWTGRIKAPATGVYTFTTVSDDGVRLWINDSLFINDWHDHAESVKTATVNLVAGEFYRLKMEYYENAGQAGISLRWAYPGQSTAVAVPTSALYPPARDTFLTSYSIREKRVNNFRKRNHISEVDVLNADGRRYVYGIPVYNLKQRELSFAADNIHGNAALGLYTYLHGIDNTTKNPNGRDNYFSSEEIPAYAHSFLLTGILSSDYVDMTGNGISDDDLGDAVKFNYSRVADARNPYGWRTPHGLNKASYNQGLKSEIRDNKASYVYGEKELWYLHSIESKTMIATFIVENRKDLQGIRENGDTMTNGMAKRLKEIRLFSKADFLKNPLTATPVKIVHFEYTYELCMGANPLQDSGKLTLKKVWFSYNGNNKGKLNPYEFHYAANKSYNTKAYDRWGNYKEPMQNPGSVTGNVLENDEYPYALQDSAVAAVNASVWNLDTVKLPSGGIMKISYESDEYAYVQHKRSMQMMKILGMGDTSGMSGGYSPDLYAAGDRRFVYVSLPVPATSARDFYAKYLDSISKLYFRLHVLMPTDQWGSGYDYVSGYAEIDPQQGYGLVNSTTGWIKLKGISKQGDGSGNYSPFVKAAAQFLRLNLPSKAYPGSEIGNMLDGEAALELLASAGDEIRNTFKSFDSIARQNNWAKTMDLNRSYIRLNDPDLRKFGGGHRVKKIEVFDNWNKMTGQREAVYGQEYIYTTKKQVNGVIKTISSGVASYEPGIGGDENPFHMPIEYTEKLGFLAPVTLGYTEEPLGESFFPSAGVGYSQVRVRSVHYKQKKSATGYTETKFYTAYDFPVFTERTIIDDDTKKRYKPALASFLKINAKHHLYLSQGFKIELNDMHGKLRSEATYSETDADHPVTYTENIYRTENPLAEHKRLSNTVTVMRPDGTIDTSALIGKDLELMVDMREQISIANGNNLNINAEIFSVPFVPPVFVLPTFFKMPQREETIFRSAAVLKIIQRYGILDSVIHIDKGSKISTKDLVYDSETGNVLLTRTQNLFDDPVYSFNYPSHWAYDAMGLAYKNINAKLSGVSICNGRMTTGNASAIFSSGDEILVAGKQTTGAEVGCVAPLSTFPSYTRIWAIDSSVVNGGTPSFYFINEDGKPYTGFNVDLTIIRSGRRNILASVGAITTLSNPLVWNNNETRYDLNLNTASKVINASANEYKQFWKVAEIKKKGNVTTCIPGGNNANAYDTSSCGNCLLPFFSYLINSQNLFVTQSANITVGTLVNAANSAGYSINLANCPILASNLSKPFFALTNGPIASYYQAKIGDCFVHFTVAGGGGGGGVAFTIPQQEILDPLNYQYAQVRPSGPMALPLQEQQAFSKADLYIDFYRLGNPTCASGRAKFSYSVYDTCVDYKIYIKVDDIAQDVEYIYTYADCNTGLYVTDTARYMANQASHTGFFGPVATITCVRQGSAMQLFGEGGLDIRYHGPCESGGTILRGSYSATMYVDSCLSCTPVSSSICYNPITDTLTNPYVYGVLGNFRNHLAYTYYGLRAESGFNDTTNIRKDGAFLDFEPFWKFTNGALQRQPDTTRWVWNSEMTLFNKKGVEVENRDPLGRYNSSLYGYYQTLPVAVIQNARYRESAFDGFEDYDFNTQLCDTACPVSRHYDWGAYKANMDSTYRHSGKRSLRVNAGQQASVAASLVLNAADTTNPYMRFRTGLNACLGPVAALDSIKVSKDILLPVFMPGKGERMVLSVWVKENLDCKCVSYTNNQVAISFTGSATTFTFTPKGPIIEGWQRYESVFDIPVAATAMAVTLKATGSATVYFDDLRIHPFNSNMKSFVFHPVNLRLMAEMDENNYGTFYEYDDDGTLIRVKKETYRGIKTIKETRSALLKQ
jgi:hypothetical protein